MRRLPAVALCLAASLGAADPGSCEQIGVAVRVRPQVLALAEPARELAAGDPIERGLRIELRGKTAYLKVVFDLGGEQTLQGFTGTATLVGPGKASFGESLLRRIELAVGRLWLSLLPGSEEVEVETPDAVLGIKGTSLRVLADPAAGTFTAVDEGVVTVQARAGGEPVTLRSGQWVLVPPGGLPTRPAPLEPDDGVREDPLIPCCPGVEPPKPPGSDRP